MTDPRWMPRLLRRAAWSTLNDGQLGAAKGAAYSALLSFFPVLTTLTTILVQANAEAVSRNLARFLFEVVPPGSEDLVRYVFTVRGSRPTLLLIVAGLLAVFAGSGVIASLMEGFQRAYRRPFPGSVWHQFAIAFQLTIVTALPALGASSLVLFESRVERALSSAFGLIGPAAPSAGGVGIAMRLLTFFIAMGSMTLITSLLYRYGSPVRPSWRAVYPGAVVATLLWLVSTVVFAWYVRSIGNYNVMYGSIGAAIALLVWMYLLSLSALFGCEYNAEIERAREAGELPSVYWK